MSLQREGPAHGSVLYRNCRYLPEVQGLMNEDTLSSSTLSAELLNLTAQIVAAHVRHHKVADEMLPSLIRTTYDALAGATLGEPKETEKLIPAVPIRRSVFPDYIVCLEDGKKLKLLKRYLASNYDMTPEEYRARWGLPPHYPMVAPNYAAHRATLARETGLGRKIGARAPKAGPEPLAEELAITRLPARRRGRPSAAK